jgi:hypothetical protein
MVTALSPFTREAVSRGRALFLVLAIVIVRTAWVCDDAYISLRSADNLVSGRGLTWNNLGEAGRSPVL